MEEPRADTTSATPGYHILTLPYWQPGLVISPYFNPELCTDNSVYLLSFTKHNQFITFWIWGFCMFLFPFLNSFEKRDTIIVFGGLHSPVHGARTPYRQYIQHMWLWVSFRTFFFIFKIKSFSTFMFGQMTWNQPSPP